MCQPRVARTARQVGILLANSSRITNVPAACRSYCQIGTYIVGKLISDYQCASLVSLVLPDRYVYCWQTHLGLPVCQPRVPCTARRVCILLANSSRITSVPTACRLYCQTGTYIVGKLISDYQCANRVSLVLPDRYVYCWQTHLGLPVCQPRVACTARQVRILLANSSRITSVTSACRSYCQTGTYIVGKLISDYQCASRVSLVLPDRYVYCWHTHLGLPMCQPRVTCTARQVGILLANSYPTTNVPTACHL